MLTFEQLEAFRLIVNVGSFSRAADELFLSQPSMSERMRHLERALGARLFHRDHNRRAVRLTPAGERVLRFANDVMCQLSQLESEIKEVNAAEVSETINIACALIPAKYLLPDLLGQYHRKYPHAHVNLIEVTGEKICALVREGEADLGILSDNYVADGFHVVTLARERAVLVAAAGHPVLSGPESWLAANRRCPFVGGRPDSFGRHIAERWASHMNLELDVVVETSSMNVIKESVTRGLGLAVLPEVAVREELRDGRIAIVPLGGIPREWPLSVIYDRNRGLSSAAQAFLAIALSGRPQAARNGRLPVARPRQRAAKVASLS